MLAEKAAGSWLQKVKELQEVLQDKRDQLEKGMPLRGYAGKELEEKPKQTAGADAGEENEA